MKTIIYLMTLISVFTLSGCSKVETNKITVLTSSGYEPYEMIDNNGELIGFDIELMTLIAEEIDIEIEFKDVSFDGIIASLQMGNAEIAIAGITPTSERMEIVDFSTVYYNSESGLKNNLLCLSEVTSLAQLNDKTISAQIGTIQANLLETISEEYNFEVDLRNSNSQIIEEIKSNRIDCLLVESNIADSIISMNSDFYKNDIDLPVENVFGNAIAFAKNSSYKDQVNEAIKTLQENGTIDELIKKWF